jgi:hypothetical protein
MSKVKYIATKECTVDGILFQEGQEVPFANPRMIESGMVKCVLDENSSAEETSDDVEVLTEKSSDVEVLTEEDSEEDSE